MKLIPVTDILGTVSYINPDYIVCVEIEDGHYVVDLSDGCVLHIFISDISITALVNGAVI